VDITVLRKPRVVRAPETVAFDGAEACRRQAVRQRLEVVRPAVFVPLMKHVVDHIHAGRQIPGKWIRHFQLTKP